MTVPIQLLPTQSWHLRDAYSSLVPLTNTALLTQQGLESGKANPKLTIWHIPLQANDTLNQTYSELRPALFRSPLQSANVCFPVMDEAGRQLLRVAINPANNRLYCLRSSRQASTGAVSLHVTRHHFDSYTAQISDFCDEVVLPILQQPAFPDFSNPEAVENWLAFWSGITSYTQLLEVTLNDSLNGGFRGQYLSQYPTFHPYHFLFVSSDHFYVVHPVYNPLAKLLDTIPIYQVMCAFQECTGLLENIYLLLPPNELFIESSGLSLRTGAAALDHQWIFSNKKVTAEETRQADISMPAPGNTPASHFLAGQGSELSSSFTSPSEIFFTSLDMESLPEVTRLNPGFSYIPLQDRYIGINELPIFTNMDYTNINVDSTQRWLYGLHEHKIQQYKIEYVGIELKHPLSGKWYLLSDLTFPGWSFGTTVEFRIRNLAQHTRLRNVCIRSTEAGTIKFSATELEGSAMDFIFTPLTLNAQQVSDSVWMHDNRSNFAMWSEFPVLLTYQLELV